MTRTAWIGLLVVTMNAGVVSSIHAQPQQEKTLRGEILDPGLYLREGRHGSEVEDLMYDAADGGQTLALLEDGTNTMYLFLAGVPGEDPNDLVYEYAGQRVSVTGTVYEQASFKGIVVTSVEPLESTPSAPSEDDPAQDPAIQ